MSDTDKMKELVPLLNKWAHEYYTLDSPSVSDAKYDEVYRQLEELEKMTGTVLPDSPTRRVGGEILKGFKKRTHRQKLYSLDKAQNLSELESWVDKIKKDYPNASFSTELKYDGLTINLTYENGALAAAATRGNGETGEDVTAQVKTVRNLPLTIGFKGVAEIQGEGMMTLSSMQKFNSENPNGQLKNARNGAAGAIRNLDPKVTAGYNLYIVCYSANIIEGEPLTSQRGTVEFLKRNGFKTNDRFETANSFAEIKDIILKIERERESYDFLIDGVVIKVDGFGLRDEIGFTSKFPKWAVAYKFEAEQAVTKLLEVIWQVGRTGKLTPLGVMEPAELAGATIRRATLNNYGDIIRKDLKTGSRVLIRRSNDVIPEVLSVVEHMPDSMDIEKPSVCPACGEPLTESGAHVFCRNALGCKPQITGRLEHYCSKNACDIEGVSEKTAEALYEKLDVTDPSGLYALDARQLLTLDKFKDKRALNILNSIEKSKGTELKNFIFGLGIDNVGLKTASDLSKKFGSVESLSKASFDELVSIEDIGGIVAQSIIDYFRDPVNLEILKRLEAAGINPRAGVKSGKLSGKRFVLTGSLAGCSRSRAAAVLESMGAQVDAAVSKNTDIVIAGEGAGSKLDKALKLGVEIWDEEKFLKETASAGETFEI